MPASVNVLVVVQKASPHLAAALQSYSQQTYPNVTVDVLCDAAAPAAQRQVKALAERLKNLRCHIGEVDSLPAGLNALVAASRADYVALTDADAIFLTDKIAAQLRLLAARPQVGAAFCFVDCVDPSGAPVVGPQACFNWQRSAKRIAADLLYDNFLCTPSVLLRRSAVQAVGAFDVGLPNSFDYDYWLRLAQQVDLAVWAEPLLRLRCPTRPPGKKAVAQQRDALAAVRAHRAPQLLRARPYLLNAKTRRDFPEG